MGSVFFYKMGPFTAVALVLLHVSWSVWVLKFRSDDDPCGVLTNGVGAEGFAVSGTPNNMQLRFAVVQRCILSGLPGIQKCIKALMNIDYFYMS